MGKSKKVTVGYKYHVGAHMALAHGPIDAVTHIWVAEKLAWSGNATGGQISINQPDLFGGVKREGGVSGTVDVAMGGSSQTVSAYLQAKIGGVVPAFRGIAALILHSVYIGTNPYLKPWKIRAKRIMTGIDGAAQWYSAKASIGSHDMNPIHILRETLTSTRCGLGYGSADIDEASFIAAADALYAEGMGMSILWQDEQPLEDFNKDVLRHIDGALYIDRVTGKFKVKLVRDDYVLGALPVLDESSVMGISEFTTPQLGEIVNSVTANYWDIATGKRASITVQDIALIQASGAVINSSIEYQGFTNGALVTKIATRDLRSLSSSASRCTIEANRSAAGLNIGDAFILNWPDFGISNFVMRVAGISFGAHTGGSVQISAVQDVFALNDATYAAPAPTEWIDPINLPIPVVYRVPFEMPYMAVVAAVGERGAEDVLAIDNSVGYVGIGAVGPTSDAVNAQVWVDSGAGYENLDETSFCPTAVLSGAVLPGTTVFPITGEINIEEVELGSWGQIDDELVKVVSIGSSTITVGRGVLDTVPASHAPGARLFFWEDFYGTDEKEYVSGEAVSVKLLTTTGKGTLALGSAAVDTVTMARRAFRPYPPGKWAIAGAYFPVQVTGVAVSTSWAHRHRTQQTGSDYLTFLSDSVGPELGTTYSVRLFEADLAMLVHSVDGLTGTDYTGFPTLTGTSNLRIEIWSVRDGYASKFKHAHTFEYVSPLPYAGLVALLLHGQIVTTTTDVRDSSLSNRTASVVGNARLETAQSKFGGASLYFDGAGDYLTYAHSADFSVTGDFTIEAWARLDLNNALKYIARKGSGAATSGFVFAVNASGKLVFSAVGPSDEAGNICTGSTTITTGAWHHLAATRQGNVLRVFVDGVLDASITTSASTSNNTDLLYIGRDPANTGRDFAGYLDEFRITSGVARYVNTFTPLAAPFADPT